MDDFGDFVLITDESHDLYPFCPNEKKIEESEVNKQLNKHDADNSARFVSLSHTELRQLKIENQSAKATKIKTECNVRYLQISSVLSVCINQLMKYRQASLMILLGNSL